MRSIVCNSLSIAACTLLFASVVKGYPGPPETNSQSFGIEEYKNAGVCCVFAKVQGVVVYYEYSGTQEAPRPAPGFFRINDTDASSAAESITIQSGGLTVFSANGPYLRIPVAIVDYMVTHQCSINLQTSTGSVSITLTEGDRASLRKLASCGKQTLQPASPILMSGELTYVVAAGHNMKDIWPKVRRHLQASVASRTGANDRSLIIFLDDDLWFRPTGSHAFSSPEDRSKISKAFEMLPTKTDLRLTPKLGRDLAEYANDKGSRSLVLIIADNLPRDFAISLVGEAEKYGQAVNIVWCGDRKPDAETTESIAKLSLATGGIVHLLK